ncbi:CopG family transcriptional regulator [Scytonema sp. UIC 10036]|uniref:CopG family transcriptional regulator n=1 Tax=Scytonema sp. UIC 10036 TaxID=2304196 RepID=UPI0012DA92D8|nr:CopG family transcriptional regulator [Scytonema sp. UIC 10036]MUG91373.1 CopG family transcriptional regulator [Scytonema sp. UIC 10036]
MPKHILNVRINDEERQILIEYCNAQERIQSDVIREFIRSLKKKTKTELDVT